MWSRRKFLIQSGTCYAAGTLPLLFGAPGRLRADSPVTELVVASRVLDVHRQVAKVHGITDPQGKSGLMVNQVRWLQCEASQQSGITYPCTLAWTDSTARIGWCTGSFAESNQGTGR